MRRTLSLLLAAASVALLQAPAHAATRPRYGGKLRVEVKDALTSLDPAQGDLLAADAALRQNVLPLVFEGLTRVDSRGELQPALAVNWQADPDRRRWTLALRSGVKLHDGNVLTARLVVTCLSASNSTWRVRQVGSDVAIESDAPMPNLPWILTQPRYSIVARNADGALIGTGPFRIAEFVPGQRLRLTYNEQHWADRPFLDAIEITFGRGPRDQALDLQLGRADVVEAAPEQLRRAAHEERRIAASGPSELLAVRFGVQDVRLREALSLAIDRAAIQNVLLQKQGEAAVGLLPAWVSGYAFLFGDGVDKDRARLLRRESGISTLTLAYSWTDPLARSVAERIAVNAREVGLNIQVVGENFTVRGGGAQARLVRVPLTSPHPAAALHSLAVALNRPEAASILSADSPEELYAAERAIRQDFTLVPVVYVPAALALGDRVKGVIVPRHGGWPFANTFLDPVQPGAPGAPGVGALGWMQP